MDVNKNVLKSIEEKKEMLCNISDSIWDYAETRFEEYKSSELLCKALAEEGFFLEKGIEDLKTAFVASFGSGKPVIGFLGEFDALHGLSQVADVSEKKPIIEGGKGHGCGHHILGVSSLAAAIAVKNYLKENNLEGTVKYFGCPGEEGGSGKVYMIRAGAFEDVDVALTWHPGSENYVNTHNMLATITSYFKFYGTSSHAGASPHLGRSALDALELMNIGANFLREHIVQEARLHYSIVDAGGLSPNVVQSKATALYQIRAPKLEQAREIYERVVNIAKGAALMTDTSMEVIYDRASSEILNNRTLESLLQKKFEEAGPVEIASEDIRIAKEIRKTFTEEEINNTEHMLGVLYGEKGKEVAKQIAGKEVIDIVYPFMPTDKILPGSTDVGDVSWVVPTGQITTACYANSTPFHSWQLVAQGKTELCHKGMLKAGEIMALAAINLFEEPELILDIKKEFVDRQEGKTYICPIPPEVKPSPRR